ncbi:MAG: dipeptidase [Candidatus Hydrogenedentota bacterium]
MSSRSRLVMQGVIALVVLLIAGAAFAFLALPSMVEANLNRVTVPGPYSHGPTAYQIHVRATVVDLHSDALLWNRNLLVRQNRGHVDVPRLAEAGVALQVFSAVTKTPKNQNYESNGADTDNITALAILQRWPRPTWDSTLQRALYQAQQLHEYADNSMRVLRVIEDRASLDEFIQGRLPRRYRVSGLLAIEGLHCLEGKIENVDVLFKAGYRMMGLTHFFDNELGGSAHGLEKGGITEFGRQVVKRMEELGIIVDLAHASPQLFDDVLAMATRPLVVSHTGVRAVCDNARNLDDDQLRAVAANGGVVGIGFWDAAICDVSVEGIVKSIQHAISVAGIEHVALGSDFDGATTTPFDASGIPKITEALMLEGMSHEDIRAVLGGNAFRVISEGIPPGEPGQQTEE